MRWTSQPSTQKMRWGLVLVVYSALLSKLWWIFFLQSSFHCHGFHCHRLLTWLLFFKKGKCWICWRKLCHCQWVQCLAKLLAGGKWREKRVKLHARIHTHTHTHRVLSWYRSPHVTVVILPVLLYFVRGQYVKIITGMLIVSVQVQIHASYTLYSRETVWISEECNIQGESGGNAVNMGGGGAGGGAV